jgi:hypothetical protein
MQTKKQQKKDPKQLILMPTPLIQIPYLDCTIADQCSSFLLVFNQKIWWTIFEGGEFSLGLTGIRSCAIQQANPAKISSWVSSKTSPLSLWHLLVIFLSSPG